MLAKQPLPRLQKLPGSSTSDPFLYDDSFLHDHVSRSALRAHGDTIDLKSGVAHGLARLAGLLKPALEIMWVDDVRRMNKFLDAEVPDVAGHLFGRERTAGRCAPTIQRGVRAALLLLRHAPAGPTTRSTMCCRGPGRYRRALRTWCWPAHGATETRARRFRQ